MALRAISTSDGFDEVSRHARTANRFTLVSLASLTVGGSLFAWGFAL